MHRNKYLIVVSLILFIVLLLVGFNLARNKPLWNDEVFSQVASVHNVSYLQIILGSSAGEGNICPLFYLIQKALVDIFRYQTPQPWLDGQWGHVDQQSMIFLRIQPVFFMALSIVVLFFYFSRYHSILTGIYSLLVSLSSYMVWLYWAEARHYALWFFLTIVQSLIFISILNNTHDNKRLYKWLIGIHILLSLTVILSLGQIVIVSFLVWLLHDKNYKRQLWLTGIPTVICLSYYFHTKATKYWLDGNYMSFIYPCISEDRLILLALFAMVLVFFYMQKKASWISLYEKDAIFKARGYLFFTILMLLASVVLMILFKIRTHGHEGNPISMRYFMYLTPVGIVAMTLFSDSLVRVFKRKKWVQLNLIIALVGLVLYSYFRNTMWVIGIY